jgi:hypothetical protein
VVKADWRPAVVDERGRVERVPYELCTLQALRDALRRREIWVVGARLWRNPELETAGVPVSWGPVAAAGLVVVGAALLIVREGRGLLITAGVAMTAASVLAAVPPVRFAGPVGAEAVAPAAADWPVESTVSVGELVVDLTRHPLPADGRVTVRVGVGVLRIIVPASGVQVAARTGLGAIKVDGRTVDQGYGPVWTEGAADGRAVQVEADVAIGSIDLHHG